MAMSPPEVSYARKMAKLHKEIAQTHFEFYRTQPDSQLRDAAYDRYFDHQDASRLYVDALTEAGHRAEEPPTASPV